MSIVAYRLSVKNHRMANCVGPDETAHYEPSHQDLQCLYRFWFWSIWLKGLKGNGHIHKLETAECQDFLTRLYSFGH